MDPPFQVNQYSRKGDKDGLWVDVVRNKRGGRRFQFTWYLYDSGSLHPLGEEDLKRIRLYEDWFYAAHPAQYTPL